MDEDYRAFADYERAEHSERKGELMRNCERAMHLVTKIEDKLCGYRLSEIATCVGIVIWTIELMDGKDLANDVTKILKKHGLRWMNFSPR